MKTKYCNGCKKTKSVSEFYKRSDRKIGYQSRCKECKDKEHTVWVENNLSKKQISQRQWKQQNPKRYWGNKTINHHRDAGFTINITNDELFNFVKDKDFCELCGKPLNWFNNKTSNDSPSLDRVDCEQEITCKNIQLLCHRCNTTKGNRTQVEFFDYCLHILRRNNYDV